MARQIDPIIPNERGAIYEEEESIRYSERYSPVARVIWFILGIVLALLGLRFLLRLFGANPAAAFTEFIYSLTAPLVDPFANVIASTGVAPGVLEWSTLLAMAVYWLVAYGIIKLATMAQSRPATRY